MGDRRGLSPGQAAAVNGFSQRVLAATAEKGVTKKRTSEGAVFMGLECSAWRLRSRSIGDSG